MAISAKTFDYMKTFVQQRSAIVLEPGKEYLVESRLAPIARAEGFGSIDELVDQLAKGITSPLHTKVIDSMTTNETTFFRDVHPFEALKTAIIPQLMKARAASRQLNFWSAACSSGQEPVTVAITIKEHFPELANWKVSFRATDLSGTMVARARTGKFSQLEINRGLPAPMLLKYFTKSGTDWVVRPDILSMIDYQEMNLVAPWPPMPPMDVILMRNVLIYFDTTTKKNIFRQVRQALRPDGYFILGSAETTMALDDKFGRVDLGRAAVYQISGTEAKNQHVRV